MAKDKKFMMTDAHSFNSQMRLEGRILTNYVNRSVVVQILSGLEVKYSERILNGLRTRQWEWVYERKKKGMWTRYGAKSAYFSFIKVINAVLVKHFFQLSLGAGPVLLLA